MNSGAVNGVSGGIVSRSLFVSIDNGDGVDHVDRGG